MPSAVVSNASGAPFPLISGNFWSGNNAFHPYGGVQLKTAPYNSGNVYIGLSGGVTIASGGFMLSGVNTTDGMIMGPGDSYFVPKLAMQNSGIFNIYAGCDAACSGQGRVFYEVL